MIEFDNQQIADDLRKIADHPSTIAQITPYALRNIADRLAPSAVTETEQPECLDCGRTDGGCDRTSAVTETEQKEGDR